MKHKKRREVAVVAEVKVKVKVKAEAEAQEECFLKMLPKKNFRTITSI